jgi:hypothetical protein
MRVHPPTYSAGNAMSTRPGEIEFTIRISGRDALDFVRMAQAAGKHRLAYTSFARRLLLDVIADDRAAHEGPAPEVECRI